jgi:hypothetical protein
MNRKSVVLLFRKIATGDEERARLLRQLADAFEQDEPAPAPRKPPVKSHAVRRLHVPEAEPTDVEVASARRALGSRSMLRGR